MTGGARPHPPVLEVEDPGPLATVQDLGRSGYGHLGVPPSGAADAASLRLANRLLGNPEAAAGIEFTLGGGRLRPETPTWVALCGAVLPVTAGGRPAAMNTPIRVQGSLELGTPQAGLRTYLAVRGGIAAERVLGSAATDVLSGLGPEPLRAGAAVPLGPADDLGTMPVTVAPVAPLAAEPVLRLLPGPREDWLAENARATLHGGTYTVAPDSDRVGLRLEGPPLPRREGELPSEGLVTGAMQVPPDGRPILFLTDHPTTGGYPAVAVLADRDLRVAAQLRPGAPVRFRLQVSAHQVGRRRSAGSARLGGV